jgi:hypothetical protein
LTICQLCAAPPETCLERLVRVQPRRLGEMDRLGEALDNSGDADLIDHLGELAVAGRADMDDSRPIGRHQRLRRRDRRLAAAAHDRKRAFLGAGLAARHRRVDDLRPRALAFLRQRRASRADAVVWSTKSAPAAIAPNAPSEPVVTSSTSRSAPTQAITASAPAAASAALAAALPPCASTQARAFAGLRL